MYTHTPHRKADHEQKANPPRSPSSFPGSAFRRAAAREPSLQPGWPSRPGPWSPRGTRGHASPGEARPPAFPFRVPGSKEARKHMFPQRSAMARKPRARALGSHLRGVSRPRPPHAQRGGPRPGSGAAGPRPGRRRGRSPRGRREAGRACGRKEAEEEEEEKEAAARETGGGRAGGGDERDLRTPRRCREPAGAQE